MLCIYLYIHLSIYLYLSIYLSLYIYIYTYIYNSVVCLPCFADGPTGAWMGSRTDEVDTGVCEQLIPPEKRGLGSLSSQNNKSGAEVELLPSDSKETA